MKSVDRNKKKWGLGADAFLTLTAAYTQCAYIEARRPKTGITARLAEKLKQAAMLSKSPTPKAEADRFKNKG